VKSLLPQRDAEEAENAEEDAEAKTPCLLPRPQKPQRTAR